MRFVPTLRDGVDLLASYPRVASAAADFTLGYSRSLPLGESVAEAILVLSLRESQ